MDDILVMLVGSRYIFANLSHSKSGKTLHKDLGITFEEYVQLLNNFNVHWNSFGMPFLYKQANAKAALEQLKMVERMVK